MNGAHGARLRAPPPVPQSALMGVARRAGPAGSTVFGRVSLGPEQVVTGLVCWALVLRSAGVDPPMGRVPLRAATAWCEHSSCAHALAAPCESSCWLGRPPRPAPPLCDGLTRPPRCYTVTDSRVAQWCQPARATPARVPGSARFQTGVPGWSSFTSLFTPTLGLWTTLLDRSLGKPRGAKRARGPGRHLAHGTGLQTPQGDPAGAERSLGQCGWAAGRGSVGQQAGTVLGSASLPRWTAGARDCVARGLMAVG